MSLYGALTSAIACIDANSMAMEGVANNITNMGTYGYKKTKPFFSTLVIGNGGHNSTVVRYHAAKTQNQKGRFVSSESRAHMAIKGPGLFVVRSLPDKGAHNYTYLGSFEKGPQGYMRNHAGYYLQGKKILTEADKTMDMSSVGINGLEAVRLYQEMDKAQMTSAIDMMANLDARTKINTDAYTDGDMATGKTKPHTKTSVVIYDSKGGRHTLTIGFLRKSVDKWQMEVYPTSIDKDILAASKKFISSGELTFDKSGKMTAIDAGLKKFTVAWDGKMGILDQSITVDIGKDMAMIQSLKASSAYRVVPDGTVAGKLKDWEITQDGVLVGIFDNGRRKPLYRLPLAHFSNLNGLKAIDGNAYALSNESGVMNLQSPNQTISKILPRTLEASNVKLGQEVANIIVLQRTFTGAGKIVSVIDRMFDRLDKMAN